MYVVQYDNKQWNFKTRQDAEAFKQHYQLRNAMIFYQDRERQQRTQYQYDDDNDRKVQDIPRRIRSIVPNMIGKHSGRNAYRVPKYDPRNPRKYDEVE